MSTRNGRAQHPASLASALDGAHMDALLGLSIPAGAIEHLADLVAERLADRLQSSSSPWLDVEAAAAHLACSRERIYDLVQSGQLEHARDGRRLLFRREHLDDYLAATTPPQSRSGSGVAGRPQTVQVRGRRGAA